MLETWELRCPIEKSHFTYGEVFCSTTFLSKKTHIDWSSLQLRNGHSGGCWPWVALCTPVVQAREM